MNNCSIYFILLIFPIFAFSQDIYTVEELRAMSLEELMQVEITTASKQEQNINEAPTKVTVITADNIKSWNALTIGDVLRFVPGFFSQSFNGNRHIIANRGFFETGLAKGAYLLLIDGRKSNNIDFGYADLLMPVHNVKQIEIIHGPGSALYGANAFLGIINIITKNSADLNDNINTTNIQTNYQIGQYEHFNTDLSFGRQLSDDFEIFSSLQYNAQNNQANKYYGINSLSTDVLAESDSDQRIGFDLFFKLRYKNFNFSSGYNKQKLHDPVSYIYQ